jgi:hypothetical protein
MKAKLKVLALASGLALGVLVSAHAADKKPNMLVIWGEDIGTWNISHNSRGMLGYDRTSPVGRLDKAWDEAVAKGWIVVSMKDDWKTILPAMK